MGLPTIDTTDELDHIFQDIPKVFDYVIVLCPNTDYTLGTFEEFDQNGLYIGGLLRMQAAVDIYTNHTFTIHKYIVVGGGLDSDPVHQWKKTENMRRFLLQNDIPKDIVTGVISGADTLGNLRAIWHTHRHLFADRVVGILSNSYHLPRAMHIVADTQFKWDNTQFFPLHAEKYIISEISPPSIDHPSIAGRIKLEKQGLLDWKNGTYTRQYTPEKAWRGALLQPASVNMTRGLGLQGQDMLMR